MEIKLIFGSWHDLSEGKRADLEASSLLSRGVFHCGTTFAGEIVLGKEQVAELRAAMNQGYRPVFWVTV